MPTPLALTLPADDELRDEVERGLAPYAEVETLPPSAFDLNEIKLLVEIVGGAASVVVSGTQIVKFLMELKKQRARPGKPSGIRVGQPGERGVPLEDADEALLRRLLGTGD